QGGAAGDLVGWSVAAAGDLNGDHYDDLVIGDPSAGSDGTPAGAAYVLYGKASGFGELDGSGRAVVNLANLTSADGFVIQGGAAGDLAGWSVSSAGDVNGDHLDDLIVGAPYGSAGGSFSGQSYVLFGKATPSGATSSAAGPDPAPVVDLANLQASDGFMI